MIVADPEGNEFCLIRSDRLSASRVVILSPDMAGVNGHRPSPRPGSQLVAPRGARARRRSPASPAPPLDGDTTADVVILGGGYTGLWTAWFAEAARPRRRRRPPGAGHLRRRAERPQRRVRQLVLARARRTWSTRYGDEAARAAVRGGRGERPRDRRVLRRARRRRVVPRRRRARRPRPRPRTSARGPTVDDARPARPSPTASRCSPPTRSARGSTRPSFRGGVFQPDGATVQPARLARGLRRVADGRGGPDLRGHAGARFGTGTPGRRRDAGRHGPRRRGRPRDERVGAALEGVPPRDHRPRLATS